MGEDGKDGEVDTAAFWVGDDGGRREAEAEEGEHPQGLQLQSGQ